MELHNERQDILVLIEGMRSKSAFIYIEDCFWCKNIIGSYERDNLIRLVEFRDGVRYE